MGFAFQLETAAGGLSSGWHEYKIGGGTLVVSPPTVTSVSVPDDTTYVAGANLDFIVNTSKNVTLDSAGGTPFISLTIGAAVRQAEYVSGSGTSAIVFRYTVQAGDEDTNGVVLGTDVVPNGGTLLDADGNYFETALINVGATNGILIDAIAPSAPPAPTLDMASNTGLTTDTLTSDTMPKINGTAEPNALVTVYLGVTSVGTALVNSEGNWSFSVEAELQTGDHSITVTATDDAGNVSQPSQALVITIDTGIPSVVLTSGEQAQLSGTFIVTITFSEPVIGLTSDDIEVSGATKGTLSGSDSIYTIDIIPTLDGIVTVAVAAGAVQDASGNSNAAAEQLSLSVDQTAPTVVISGPSGVVTDVVTVSFTFSEFVNGFEENDISVTNGSKGIFAEITVGLHYTLQVTPVLGKEVSIFIPEGRVTDAHENANTASTLYVFSAGSPAAEFDKQRDDIREVVIDEAARSLQSNISVNRRVVGGARERFIESRIDTTELPIRKSVPLDIDGDFAVSGTTLSTRGSVYALTENFDGPQRRLFSGDFDVQHDSSTGSSTATLTARVAWEQMMSEHTMLGYFIGGELVSSNISGAFEGTQDRVAVTTGGYAVHQLAEQAYLDGFLAFGAGRNNLEMGNDALALVSDYTTRTTTVGVALSGMYENGLYQFHPELAISYGKTWIGNVGFTGRAYGLVDEALNLEVGNVSIANLTFRPEVVWALDADTIADGNSRFSFAPRLICERTVAITRSENCGGGAEIGIISLSEDGLSSAGLRLIKDYVGSSYRSMFA